MKSRLQSVILIGFEEYNNLGMGYLSAVIQKEGFKIQIVDLRKKDDEILKIVKRTDPFIIGFSVIFQYHIYQFRDLAGFLRENGIDCHFTAGGYFASLRYRDLFKFIPSLDSSVRFEGEYTFLELVRSVKSGSDWRKIEGLAYRNNGDIITNSLRPLEKDLDKFPYPFRISPTEYAFDRKFAAVIAGRGCVHNCAYCNTREFYRLPPGPVKRLRRPERVVEEIKYLFNYQDCSVFLFQDDDFPVVSKNRSEWISTFCDELIRKKLHKKIIWKINCRPDEVSEDIFGLMESCGLFLVFMGIEDGTDDGLKSLNRKMTIARSLDGIRILKKLKIGFDYGFMLFQPQTTYKTLHKNIRFLKQICGDGYTPVTYLKLIPYFNTRVESDLRKDSRLKGRPGFYDYDFPETSMNHYYNFVKKCFLKWQLEPEGLANISKWTRNYLLVYKRFCDAGKEYQSLEKEFKKITRESNLFLIGIMEELAGIFESGQYHADDQKILKKYSNTIRLKHKHYLKKITECLQEIINLADDFSPLWLFS